MSELKDVGIAGAFPSFVLFGRASQILVWVDPSGNKGRFCAGPLLSSGGTSFVKRNSA